MENKKQELIESWYRLSSLARRHSYAKTEFNRLAEEYYGIEWHQLQSLVNNDRIIDTMDSLTFKELDELIRSAIEDAKNKEDRRSK